jgi:hypothetical protein
MPPAPKLTVAKMTIAQYTAALKKLHLERDAALKLPETDKNRRPTLQKLHEDRARMLAPIAPILRELIDSRALEFQYEGAPEKEGDAWLTFDLHDIDLDRTNGVFTLLSYGVGDCSDPPPPLETDEGVNLLRILENEGEVVRVPVTSHVILQDRIDHGDHSHKNIRQVALLADDFYSSEQAGDVEVVGVQPAIRRVDAVFGIIVDDLQPSDVSIMSIDALLRSEKIVLLGYEYDGERRAWSPDLEILRDVMSHDREPGVVIDGKFRRLPRLDLSRDEGDEHASE